MGKKKTAERSTATEQVGGARFDTRIYADVPNDEVLDRIGIEMENPKYVSHTIVPQGDGKSTIVVVLRK